MGRYEIASRLKEARERAGLTQKEAADKVGLTPQAISNFERGINQVSNDVLRKLCDLYKVSPDIILDDFPLDGSSLDDVIFLRLLRAEGYFLEGNDLNKKIYFGKEDSGSVPIVPDEYRQLRDSVLSYIKVNAQLLFDSAKKRESSLIQVDTEMSALIGKTIDGAHLTPSEEEALDILTKRHQELYRPFRDALIAANVSKETKAD